MRQAAQGDRPNGPSGADRAAGADRDFTGRARCREAPVSPAARRPGGAMMPATSLPPRSRWTPRKPARSPMPAIRLIVNGTTPHRRRRARHPAALGAARDPRPDRHQVRLRRRACAAPAPCTSTASPCAPAVTPVARGRRHAASPRSRACPPTAATRVQRPGSRSRCRSAATASRARSWRAAALLAKNPDPTDAEIDARDGATTCAAAGPTRASAAPSTAPPKGGAAMSARTRPSTPAASSCRPARSPAPGWSSPSTCPRRCARPRRRADAGRARAQRLAARRRPTAPSP